MRTIKNAFQSRATSQRGWSMIDVLIAMVVLGILAAIAIPVFITQMNELNSQRIRADLQQAAMIVEQEAIDNNGLYPTYVPNEMRSNPDMDEFVLTYNDARTRFCVQAEAPVGWLFVSETNQVASHSICTQENVAEGSPLPWDAPTVSTPTILQASNTWQNTQAASVATIRISPVTCVLSADDQENWGTATAVTYSVRLRNVDDPSLIIANTPWTASPNVSVALQGWIPDQNVTYEARARCTITSGAPFDYDSDYSAPFADVVDRFDVPTGNYSVAPSITWVSNNLRANQGTYRNSFLCPAGERSIYNRLIHAYDASTGASGNYEQQSNTVTNSTAQALGTVTLDKARFSIDDTVRFATTLRCAFPNGTYLESPETTVLRTVPLPPPTNVPTTVRTSDRQTGAYLNDTAFWTTNATCQAGFPEYRVSLTATGISQASDWTTDRGLLIPTENRASALTMRLESRCNYEGQFSPSALGGSTSLPAGTLRPFTPATPTVTSSFSTPTSTAGQVNLAWTSVSCPTGSTAYYRVMQYLQGNQYLTDMRLALNWATQRTFNSSYDFGQYSGARVGFEVQAACATDSATAAASRYTSVPGPMLDEPGVGRTVITPTRVSGSPSGNPLAQPTDGSAVQVYNSTWTCPNGSTPQFRIVQTRYGSTMGTWTTNWSSSNVHNLPMYTASKPYTYAAYGQARCVSPLDPDGDARTSAITTSSVTGTWTRSTPTTSGSPYGSLDSVGGGTGVINVNGWAIDPTNTAPTQIHVYVGGIAGSGAPGYAYHAGYYRADVGRIYAGYGDWHGFNMQVPAPRGTHQVCFYYINADNIGGGHYSPGCLNVTVN